MQIIHRVSVTSSPETRRELSRFGVVVPAKGFVTFEVDESVDHWASIREWIAEHRAVDIVRTTFTEAEIGRAQWLELEPEWHNGYPQPSDDFGYVEATYDSGEWCDSCGIARVQTAPFRLRKEPRWGRRGIMQLNWIFDEYFVSPAAWKNVFRPHGVRTRPVHNKAGAELETVLQLDIGECCRIDTSRTDLTELRCNDCGRAKFEPMARGPFPALLDEPAGAIVKTEEYFGSGASAHRRVLVSQALARTMLAHKLRGARLRPVEDVPPPD